MDKENLNARYREQGWARITDAALGTDPVNVEGQAREVARWAHHMLVKPPRTYFEEAAKRAWGRANETEVRGVSWEHLPEIIRQRNIDTIEQLWHEIAESIVEHGAPI